MKFLNGASLLLIIVFCFNSVDAKAQVKIDPKLPDYKPVGGVSGSIKSVGSDTMNNLMALWSEGFQKFYPNVRMEVEGKGSSTAMPALISGTATFGPMSRAAKAQEINDFEKRFGFKPTQVAASIDMLAVYVNKDNPIKKLTLPQTDAIFGKNRNLGFASDIRTWGDAGLTGTWANAPISLFGRNAASGTYGYFKEHTLGKGDFKDTVKEQPGSAAVVQGVARDKNGIGYSGIGYKTADVRAVPLSKDAESDPISASPENASKYPLARFLWLTVNHKPGTQLDPLRKEFIRFIFSKQGQKSVIEDGYLPVPAKLAERELKKLGISLK